jgi:hypothetical protein
MSSSIGKLGEKDRPPLRRVKDCEMFTPAPSRVSRAATQGDSRTCRLRQTELSPRASRPATGWLLARDVTAFHMHVEGQRFSVMTQELKDAYHRELRELVDRRFRDVDLHD